MNGVPKHNQIRMFRAGSEQLAIISGFVGLENCEDFKTRMLAALHVDCKTFYAYTQQVQDLDSAGLGSLVGLHITCKRRGVQFLVVAPSASQMRRFEFTKLNTVLKIMVGSEAEALRTRIEKPEFEVNLEDLR